jgi:DNA-binding NtrC family response regulator
MAGRTVTLMAIDDDPQALALIEAALARDELNIVTATDPEQGLAELHRLRPQIAIIDLRMPKMSGLELLDRIVEIDASVEVLVVTADDSAASAVDAIHRGARDYFTKPVDIEALQNRVDGLIAEALSRQHAQNLDRELIEAYRFGDIVGRSPLMLDVFARLRRVAPHYRTALVTGPTGTGKELVARALHRLGPVRSGPFAVCSCAALTETLIESELFGYAKGAFTGATQDKTGLFEYANEGTLFLDEIGEMSLPAQAKVLRAIQNQEIQRVGSPQVRKVNVRIVAATNRDLRECVRRREFREDLFFRLSMVEIKLPALAERKEDLPLLIGHFAALFAARYGKPIAGLTRRAEAALSRHNWPGNVRELENVIGYAAMMTDSAKIDAGDLPEYFRTSQPASDGAYPMVSIDEIQRVHARRVVEGVGGNKAMAASVLGVSRATLYRLLADDSQEA